MYQFSKNTPLIFSNAAGSGQWLQMDHELETRNGQTVGTRGPTGHNLLTDVRFELPFGEWLLFRIIISYSMDFC